MILCLLRIAGFLGVLITFLVLKTAVLWATAACYLASAVLLQHVKATCLDDLCETCLCWVSAEVRSSVLLQRVQHLEGKAFHPYYHGRKPSAPVLFEGLSIVCDWWRTQSPDGRPASVVVYLRLTCKTLHQLEQLAATHLNRKAPLCPGGVQGALKRPARLHRVQAVSYLHHKPEQVQALTLFASAWPNLRQLRVGKPQYLYLRPKWDLSGTWLWHDSSSSSSMQGMGAVMATADPAAAAAAEAALTGSMPKAATAPAANTTSSPSSSSSSSSSYGQYSSREGAVLHLVAGLVSAAHHWPSLQCLSLSNIGLTPAAAQLLVQAAVQWPLLRYLDVTNNSLGPGGVQVLLDAAMQYWQQLEVIDIRGNLQLDILCSSSSSSSGSGGSSGGSSSSSSIEGCGLLELLGIVSDQASQLWCSSWRKVIVQSQKGSGPRAPAVGDDDGLSGSGLWHGSSSVALIQQQQQQQHDFPTYGCRYIPTEGLVARQVYLLL